MVSATVLCSCHSESHWGTEVLAVENECEKSIRLLATDCSVCLTLSPMAARWPKWWWVEVLVASQQDRQENRTELVHKADHDLFTFKTTIISEVYSH